MIYFIMGKSSVGKDTLLSNILNNTSLKSIITYTTRPIRTNETQGKEYYFVDENFFQSHKETLVEERTYNTPYGLWRYFTLPFDETEDKVVVGPLSMYKSYKKQCKNVVPLYIELDDKERYERALKREKLQQNPKYDELKLRFQRDNEDFKKIYDVKPFVLNGSLSEKDLLDEFILFKDFYESKVLK